VRANGTAKRPHVRAVELPVRFPTRVPRAHLEGAIAELTEENVRLRREISAHASLWQIAHQDQLTELWNRRYVDKRLAEEMSRTKRESGYRFSMVLVDVDNLKRINDETGHTAGDEALRWVARFLKEGLRGHDLCSRWGGDEFLLVLPGSGEQECGDLVERIRRRWRSATAAGEPAVPVSIGTASFPNQGTDVESLLVVADEEMYADKSRQARARPSRPTTKQSTPNEIRLSPRFANVAERFKRLLLFLACVFGMTCATSQAPGRSGDSRGRGLIVSSRQGAIAIVTGPVLLHAYSDTSGTQVYLAPAVTGADGDCALPAGAGTPEADQMLKRNQSLVLEVPTGSVACAIAGAGKPVEILWHALARREASGPVTAQRQ
jgi:diguanylate cyclase (GGDEF)-like protein